MGIQRLYVKGEPTDYGESNVNIKICFIYQDTFSLPRNSKLRWLSGLVWFSFGEIIIWNVLHKMECSVPIATNCIIAAKN